MAIAVFDEIILAECRLCRDIEEEVMGLSISRCTVVFLYTHSLASRLSEASSNGGQEVSYVAKLRHDIRGRVQRQLHRHLVATFRYLLEYISILPAPCVDVGASV
jgi:hypothetical protein